jgi:hypothetical protein
MKVNKLPLTLARALVATCLLLVLVSGVMTQIAGQFTLSIALFLDTNNSIIHVLIDDKPYCTYITDPPSPSFLTKSLLTILDKGGSMQLMGDTFEGADNLGNKIGKFAGKLTFEPTGSNGEFIAAINFTVAGTSSEILHSESKFTGRLVPIPGTIEKAMMNVKSEYAFMESSGVLTNLQLTRLEPASGFIPEDDVTGVICLPTFTFSIPAPVGGVVLPTSKLEVVAPFVALVGLVAVVSAIAVVKRRRD